MRIGNRLGGAMALAVAAVISATTALAAAERVTPVPLGGTLPDQKGDRGYGVYVPTKFGGVLTVKASSGTVENLTGPDGRPRRNGEEVGNDSHGWYTFVVRAARPEKADKDADKADKDAEADSADKTYSVSTTFVQVGEAARMPWNFYYWPTKGDCIHEPWAGGNARVDTPRPYGDDVQVAAYGSYIAPGQDIILPGANGLLETPVAAGDDSTWFPNLYDDLTFKGADGTLYETPSPLLKYDQIFGTNVAKRLRKAMAPPRTRTSNRWRGHIRAGAVVVDQAE